MSLKGMVFYTCYNIINGWQMRMNWRVRVAMKKATGLIAATKDVQTAIYKLYGKDSVIIPEVGLIGNGESQISRRQSDEKLKICWSGQHTSGKSLNLLFDSIALGGNEKVELHVIGEGSETKRWKRKSKRLGLKNIVWHGWIPRDEGLRIMQSCHLFCITSLKDLTSTVILEALSFGLPVIALDHCGFSNVLTPTCGIKIAINNKKQVVEDYNKAIMSIEKDENKRYLLAKGAQMRSKEFNWEDKAEAISKIYETVSVQNI
jgi:glycosyltransferase involved in cell wall biosynthesis